MKYLSENKSYFKKKYFIDKIGITGSFSRDDFNENSDIDFVVIFNDEAKKNRMFRLYINLQEELEKQFGRRVDIIVNDTVLPAFQDKVLNETIYV
ncbi:MAG: nucleotidyltransferase domain-containing protein [Bacteroidales bacterium]